MNKWDRINTAVLVFLLVLNALGWKFGYKNGDIAFVGARAFFTGVLLATLIWKWAVAKKN